MQVQTPSSAGKMVAMGNLIEEPMAIRVALVEDDQELRASVASLLKRAAGLQVVVACGSAEEALTELATHQPDVVLMDVNLPGADGVECVRRLKLMLPSG